MHIVVRAFPVLAGKECELRELIGTLRGARSDEADAFFRGYGLVRESWYRQLTPSGEWVIVCSEVGEVEAAAETYAASEHPFDRWFKTRVKAVTGVDPDKQPLGPPTELVYEWRS